MVDYYTPACVFAESTLWLPVPITRWDESVNMRNVTETLPKKSGALLLDQQVGVCDINITGSLIGLAQTAGFYTWNTLTYADARTIYENMVSKLTSGTFKLYRYHNRYWPECVLSSFPRFLTNVPDTQFGYSLSIQSLNPPMITGSDITASQHPWKNVIVGQSQSGGTAEVPVTDRRTYVLFFDGVAAVATAQQDEKRIQINGPSGATATVKSVAITSVSSISGTGTTTIKVSDDEKDQGGSVMSLSIDETARRGYQSSGSFSVSVGTDGSPVYLYAWIDAAGPHEGLEVSVDVEISG